MASKSAKTEVPPEIPDLELLQKIGEGSYGEVWLAKTVIGGLRAVKIISRDKFHEERCYEREIAGLQKFEPISRSHPGFVAILHTGRIDPYFYYTMELADDATGSTEIDPAKYVAKSLSSEKQRRGRIPLGETVRIGLDLSDALGYLHRHSLIHRDIKPSNTIFVGGRPKIADIGLVTDDRQGVSMVGTLGYMAAEPPGRLSDIFSLGKLLYEISTGKGADEFPELPAHIEDDGPLEHWRHLNEILLKACELDASRRFQSAEDLHRALQSLAMEVENSRERRDPVVADKLTIKSSLGNSDAFAKRLQVSILYKSNVQPDGRVLEFLQHELGSRGNCEIFVDRHLAIGVEWAREIEQRIRNSDAVVILLSGNSVQSEMLAYEVEIADQAAQQYGKPKLLPVRLGFTGPLPAQLATLLDARQYFLWENEADDSRLMRELLRALRTSAETKTPKARLKLESIGGAVPLDSQFYVMRPADQEFATAIARRDSIILVKGARQMGKTSLLARGLQQAREAGAKVVMTDFQKLNSAHLASVESFFLTLGEFLADQLELEVFPEQVWDKRRSANTNFERYLRREVMGKMQAHFVWGLDEVDRLFTCDFGSEVFGLFRAWHNERALDPEGPWSRMSLVIAYATEAHLFITDVNQSPFNVGTRLTLEDFTREAVADLNERYGSPLRNPGELRRFYQLIGGQPYLVRRALNALAAGDLPLEHFAQHADRDEGIFGDHLRRILVLLAKDRELTDVVRGLLSGKRPPIAASFYRLRSAGVIAGDSPAEARPRCEIYASYLKRHLL